MGYLKVDIEAARGIAVALGQNAEARLGDLASLGSRANPDNIWEGEAATAYRERYEAWRTAENNLVEALRQLGVVVNNIITNFDEINQSGAGALRV
jgi:WXG100 family type VII secretion target